MLGASKQNLSEKTFWINTRTPEFHPPFVSLPRNHYSDDHSAMLLLKVIDLALGAAELSLEVSFIVLRCLLRKRQECLLQQETLRSATVDPTPLAQDPSPASSTAPPPTLLRTLTEAISRSSIIPSLAILRQKLESQGGEHQQILEGSSAVARYVIIHQFLMIDRLTCIEVMSSPSR